MTTIKIDAAVEKLAHTVAEMRADDLVQVYNELFPDHPVTEVEAGADMRPLSEKIERRLASGVEPEEVVDLWNVVFPESRDVFFNEEEDVLSFESAQEAH